MKKIYYKSVLPIDIENVKIKDKISDIIKSCTIGGIIINVPIIIGLVFISTIDTSIARLIPFGALLTTFLDSYLFVLSPIKKIKARKEKAKKSFENIKGLTYQISNDLDEETNFLVNSVEPETIINAIAITNAEVSRHLENFEEYQDQLENIVTSFVKDYYFLDKNDKLIVLREIKNVIKENNREHIDSDLYVLEKNELPTPLPVIRRLEVK